MVRGVGVDILEIHRLRTVVDRWGDRFLRKVFTQREIEYCRTRHDAAPHLAARFAAKEAVSKALATGWAGDFHWKDVEVTNSPSGQPQVTVHGRLGTVLRSAVVHLSLSHSDSHVVAMALIEEHLS